MTTNTSGTAPGAPPAKRRKLDFSTSATVVLLPYDLDERTHTFSIPVDALSKRSRFFSAVLEEEWWKAGKRLIKLENVNVEHFNVYVQWLMTEEVVLRADIGKNDAWPELIELWLLANHLDDIQLRNSLIYLIVKQRFAAGNLPSYLEVNQVWSRTNSQATIRRLLLRMFCTMQANRFREHVQRYDHSFVQELCALMLENLDPQEMNKECLDMYYEVEQKCR